MAFIYGLYHPQTDTIRYVGKTVTPLRRRLSNHEYRARSGRNKGPVGNWIRRLQARGLRPVIRALEEVRTESWQAAERRWVSQLRKEGRRLLNRHPGGNGAHSRAALPAELQKLLGVISDARIAERAGLCRETITYHRRRAGIPASGDRSRCGGVKGLEPHNKTVLPQMAIDMMGKVSDKTIAERTGYGKGVIRSHRVALRIPAYNGPPDHRTGVNHHNAKLSPASVRTIKRRYLHRRHGDRTVESLAREFGVHITTIYSVVREKTWR